MLNFQSVVPFDLLEENIDPLDGIDTILTADETMLFGVCDLKSTIAVLYMLLKSFVDFDLTPLLGLFLNQFKLVCG